MKRWESWVGLLGLVLVLVGSYMGLFVAPRERFMGDVQRIMYIHVPTAQVTLLIFTATFVGAVGWLWKQAWKWDHLVEGSIHTGLLFGALLAVQGAVWAKPTWGVWWTWDPRLTSVAVMVLSFLGILALRSFVDDPVKRATWSATASVIAWVNIPFVYLCVRWMASLHQTQTQSHQMDPAMKLPLNLSSIAVLLIAIHFVAVRWRIAARQRARELAE